MNNEDNFKGKWEQIKGEIQRTWGRLTSDELEESKGDLRKIAGVVEEKYGEARDVVLKKIAEFSRKLEEKVTEKTDETDPAKKDARKDPEKFDAEKQRRSA